MNKNVKKILSVFLGVIMIFSLFTVTSFAEEQKPAIKLSIDGEIALGKVVRLLVNLENMPEFTQADFYISFDSSNLECQGVTKPATCGAPLWVSGIADDGLATCSICYFSPMKGQSDVAVVAFKVINTANISVEVSAIKVDCSAELEKATINIENTGDFDPSQPDVAFDYELINSEIIITDCYMTSAGDIIIPETIDGYPVTAIDMGAFEYKSGITSITIPDSVTSIGDMAFNSCDKIVSMVIPNGVQSIGYRTFAWCESLTSINIPDSVTSIDEKAFFCCTSLTSITIPDSVTTIGDHAIGYQYVSDNYELIDGFTIYGISGSAAEVYANENGIKFVASADDSDNKTEHVGFTYKVSDNGIIVTSNDEKTTGDIVIPSEIDGLPVTAIGREEFYGFRNVTSITIPATVTDIDISTFSTCSELEKFIVDENNQYYSSDEHGVLFDKSKSKLLRYSVGSAAEEYIIPDGVTVIGEESFARAKKLKEIKISNTVTTIEASAFLVTWELERIVIPDSVTKLTGNAFSNSGIKSAVLPAGITAIETRLFDKCTKLESVVIPASITKIDDFAFSMCDKLENVYYTGSQEDWNKIAVSDVDNSALTNADINFNYDGVVMYDVNGDGNINAADARIALRASAKLEVLEGSRFTAADVDKNGKVTAADARLILRKAAKLD